MATFNPNSLANLKKFDSDTARKLQAKSVQSRMLNKEIREQYKLTAKNFKEVLAELPEMSSLDVIRMAMMDAMQKDDMEAAARYAAMLAEFEAPKLQRIEQNTTLNTGDLSEDELKKIIEQEGLAK